MSVCKCGFCNVCVCVCVCVCMGFVMCGSFDNCVLLIRVLVFTVFFVLFVLCVFIIICY